jgi:hypothetical protein
MRALLLSGLFGLALSAAAPAQGVPGLLAGYRGEVALEENRNALALRGFALGPFGSLFAGVGETVVEVDPSGARQVLHQFAPGGGAGMIERPASGLELFFVESGTETLWRRHVVTGQQSAGSVPANTFDLARAPGGEILVSANPGWPAAGAENGIWLVDFAGGNHREVIALQGPSGPLAFDARGDLYYAVQSWIFPTPPGAVSIVRFDAARVQAALRGGPALSLQDATTLLAADGAYRLAIDDRSRLYWSDPQHGGIERTLPGIGARDPVPFLARPLVPGDHVVTQVQFADNGAATFDPYQPAWGGVIGAMVTDWATRAEVLTMRASRPALASLPVSPVPAGPLLLLAAELPPNAAALLCVSGLPPVSERSLLSIGGSPLWSALDFSLPPLCAAVRADAAGAAQLALDNPGGFFGTVHFQVLGFSPNAALWPFGTSAVLSLQLLP